MANKRNRFLKLFSSPEGQESEKPEPTTESIRASIEAKRKETDDADAIRERKFAKVREGLKIFPVNFPASSSEIAEAYNDVDFDMFTSNVLYELVDIPDSGWEYVSDKGFTCYQRTK